MLENRRIEKLGNWKIDDFEQEKEWTFEIEEGEWNS